VELNLAKILSFLNMVNLESHMHQVSINCCHMGHLHQLIQNPDMRSFILSGALQTSPPSDMITSDSSADLNVNQTTMVQAKCSNTSCATGCGQQCT
jgi:hypothetical protein